MNRRVKEIWTEKIMPFVKKDNLILMILAGILLIVISLPVERRGKGEGEGALKINEMNDNSEAPAGTDEPPEETASFYVDEKEEELYRIRLQSELEALLEQIEGAGKVRVMITFKESRELIVEKDRKKTQKQTMEGTGAGKEKSASESILSENTILEGDQEPLIVKEIYPRIEGVVIAAQGVGTGRVRSDISEAVQVLFGLEAHKVKVLKLENISSRTGIR